MNMSKLQVVIEKTISARIINHPKEKKMLEYAAGKYNPTFAFVVREGLLCCVWVGNVQKNPKKGQVELDIWRVGNTKLVAGFTYKEWDMMVRRIMPYAEEINDKFLFADKL